MLDYNPAKRPTIKELLEHPWMRMKSEDGRQQDNAKVGKELKKMMNEHKFDKSTQDTDSTKI